MLSPWAVSASEFSDKNSGFRNPGKSLKYSAHTRRLPIFHQPGLIGFAASSATDCPAWSGPKSAQLAPFQNHAPENERCEVILPSDAMRIGARAGTHDRTNISSILAGRGNVSSCDPA